MKKQFFFAAVALVALASCSSEEIIGDSPTPNPNSGNNNAIVFTSNTKAITRAGELVGATAAEKLGGMFVVEGTKGTEDSDAPSSDVVFDNYLVGYEYNSAGTQEDNTNNWEYVGKQTGITGKLSGDTWTALHGTGANVAKEQTIKYWDYSVPQYDFIAWSTGTCEAVTTAAESGKVQVTRINTGTTLATNGFTLTAVNVDDLKQCYFTDINKVLKANYNEPVTLIFKSMATKVRVALYETIPGYSVKDVYFYTSDENPTAPEDLGAATDSEAKEATLFTMGSDKLPKSGSVLVTYPHIGTNNKTLADYNKASVSVTAGATEAATQAFGNLSNFVDKERYELAGTIYLGRNLTEATFAGSSEDNYYAAVFPNSNGKALTLRVDYTLVSTDGSGETIKVYGAKAVVPPTYTVWQPNYAYTYVFKISDNTNGWTNKTVAGAPDGPAGLFPITFDAVVASVLDGNNEQTTVTTVATPSITTYQQGHTKANNEYSKTQTAGVSSDVKDLYVQVMDNSGATSSLASLTASNSLLFSVATTGAPISEATVMDALQNRTNTYDAESPAGRNGITLTKDANIAISAASGTFDEIVNGVDDNPISVGAGEAAKIAIGNLTAGKSYAYVYVKTAPTSDERIYNVVADATASSDVTKYYEVKLTGSEDPLTSGTAAANKVYFVKNFKADGTTFDSYTFKQTKVGESVVGLVEATIVPATKASEYHADSEGNYYFYFDVYNQNKGVYAVKVIKIVA